MEEALVALLLADTPLAALVSGRIRWMVGKQDEDKPYIVLTRVSSIDAITYKNTAVLTESRVQADCYALTYAKAKAVARAVKAAIDGKGSGQSAVIDRIFYDTERDLFEPTADPDKLFRVSVDYRVFHR